MICPDCDGEGVVKLQFHNGLMPIEVTAVCDCCGGLGMIDPGDEHEFEEVTVH